MEFRKGWFRTGDKVHLYVRLQGCYNAVTSVDTVWRRMRQQDYKRPKWCPRERLLWMPYLFIGREGLSKPALISWSSVLLEKPAVAQLVKEFPAFYATRSILMAGPTLLFGYNPKWSICLSFLTKMFAFLVVSCIQLVLLHLIILIICPG
jgi:hypothetical protein